MVLPFIVSSDRHSPAFSRLELSMQLCVSEAEPTTLASHCPTPVSPYRNNMGFNAMHENARGERQGQADLPAGGHWEQRTPSSSAQAPQGVRADFP